ncbi:MAG: hypothetical protein V4560_10590 [Bacteroidota bacterium]
MNRFLFEEKMDAYHIGGAIFGGICSGLSFTFLPNRVKRRATMQA